MKTKIVLLLLSLVFLASGVLLFISVTTFKNDKIAYIYETITNQTSSTANQFKGELDSADQIVLTYLNEYNKAGKIKQNPEDTLPDNSTLRSLEIYGLENATEQLLSSIERADYKNVAGLKNKILKEYAPKIEPNKKSIFYHDGLTYILTLVQETPYKVVLIYVFKSNAISDLLDSTSDSHITTIVNKDFQTIDLLASAEVEGATFDPANFPGLKEMLIASDISDIKTGQTKSLSKEEWIYSSSNLGVDDFYVITMVPVSKALSVMKTIYFKSIVSFLMIMSLVIIIGIISASNLTSQLKALTNATEKVIAGDFSTQVQVKGEDEIAILTNGFNKMTSELTRLMSETAEKARMESELKTAQLVQENLLPPESGNYTNCKVSGYYKSASECGGDWWFHSEDEKHVHIIIADATGHGASAALMTSAIKSAFSLIVNMNLTPQDMVSKLNQALCGVSHGKIMMTAFYFRIDKATNTAEYVNASHEAPILIDMNLEKITKKDLIFFNENNSARLGQSLDTVYECSRVELKPNQRIFFYTDGIFDLRNGEGTKITEREFYKNFISFSNAKTDFQEFSSNVKNYLVDFHKMPHLDDDVTICHLEVTS